MTTDAEPTAPRERRAALPVWAIATIAGVFALFYAYAFWNALSFLIEQVSGGLGINGYGWFVLIMAVAFPVIAFAIAFAVGWRRGALPFTLVLLTGLCVACVFWLNVLAYTQVAGASLLGA
jgi:hypothetical protein